MELERIKSLAKQDDFTSALAECNKLLKELPNNKAEILRTRAYVYARSGDYDSALKDRETIFEMGDANIKDYYHAGNNALSMGELAKASIWFKEVLRLGEEQHEKWFDSAVYFLIAYTQMEMGNYEEAKTHLNSAVNINPNCSMPLPKLGMWDHNRLRKEIDERRSK